MDSEALKLAHKDSNLNKQNQNLLCYRYTMSQCLKKRCKGNLVFLTAQGFFRFFGKNQSSTPLKRIRVYSRFTRITPASTKKVPRKIYLSICSPPSIHPTKTAIIVLM